MKPATFALSLIATAACLAGDLTLPGVGTVQAGVQKCVSPEGQVTYTDLACAGGQQAAALPKQLASALTSSTDATAWGVPASVEPATPQRGPRVGGGGCSRSVAELKSDLAFAFASRDINRIAESYHWNGVDQKQARAVLDRLESMSRQRVSGSDYFGAADLGSAIADDGLGQLQWTTAQGSRVPMQVTRQNGCYLARF